MSMVELLNVVKALGMPSVIRVIVDGEEIELRNPKVLLQYRHGLLVRIVLDDGRNRVYRDLVYDRGLLVEISEWRRA